MRQVPLLEKAVEEFDNALIESLASIGIEAARREAPYNFELMVDGCRFVTYRNYKGTVAMSCVSGGRVRFRRYKSGYRMADVLVYILRNLPQLREYRDARATAQSYQSGAEQIEKDFPVLTKLGALRATGNANGLTLYLTFKDIAFARIAMDMIMELGMEDWKEQAPTEDEPPRE